MKIFTINCPFKDVLHSLGHDVLEFNIGKSGIYNIASILKQHAFSPDVIIQREHLGAKVIVSGLHQIDCKKAFWSIDTHLNYFWQMYYARLFDVLFTPHKNYLSESYAFGETNAIIRLPDYAQQRDFVPHGARLFDINMVARMSEHRPCRNNLAKILKNFYSTEVVDDVSYEEMMSLYSNTRIIPNEAIAFETNFRILEVASCGGCLLSPQIGADQDEMFQVGQEILVYNDAAELLSLIDYCKSHTNYTEMVGRAAWEKVQRTHLLKHRVATALEEIAKADTIASKNEDYFTATVCMMSMSRQIIVPELESYFAKFQSDVLKNIMIVTQIILSGQLSGADALLTESLEVLHGAQEQEKDFSKSLAILCGGYSLYIQKIELSYKFFKAYSALCGESKMTATNLPRTPDDLYACWIDCLKADGRSVLYGMGHSGYAQTALDMVLIHLEREELGYSWAVEMLSVPAVVKTNPGFSQGAAARIALSDGSIENNMVYIEQSLRLLDIDRAVETIKEVMQQLPTQNSKQAFRNALLKKYEGLERILLSC